MVPVLLDWQNDKQRTGDGHRRGNLDLGEQDFIMTRSLERSSDHHMRTLYVYVAKLPVPHQQFLL
jgi:hypothetical protein